MKVAAVKKPGGLENIVIEDRPDPTPGPGEILVRVRASSLNTRRRRPFRRSMLNPSCKLPCLVRFHCASAVDAAPRRSTSSRR